MRITAALLIAAISIGLTLVPAFPQTTVDVVQQAGPSVAFVLATGDQQPVSGSAFVVDPAGLLVTALHVVADARVIWVLLPGGRPQRADVLAINVTDDLAVLRIAQPGLPALSLAAADPVTTGEDVIAVGYPVADVLGPYDVTVTRGLVSGVRRPFFQIDATIDPGNSGGPVFDEHGSVVGIAEGLQAISGAVSVTALRTLLAAAALRRHTSTPLPLTTMRPVQLTYRSGGIGGGGQREERAAACVSPPAGARSLQAVHGELDAFMTLDVTTWLSFRTGAAAGASGTFGELGDVGGHYLDAATWRDVNTAPDTVCLNYAATNSILLPIGMTFRVAYTLFFNTWSPAAIMQGPR